MRVDDKQSALIWARAWEARWADGLGLGYLRLALESQLGILSTIGRAPKGSATLKGHRDAAATLYRLRRKYDPRA